jgi:hypothetical protein
MIYYIILLIILAIITFKFFINAGPKDVNKYKFLFRNDIFSSTKKGGTTYQLAPVMRGKAYKPSYLYFPDREQYLVYGSLEPFGFRRYDFYAPPHKVSVRSHVLLNSKGEVLQTLNANLNFSVQTGLFFTPEFYINWLESGDRTEIPYAGRYNQDMKMNSIQFADRFRELYAEADYIEFVNLRTQYSDRINAGVVFKIKQEWHILLDSENDSHIYAGNLKEDKRTEVDTYTYRLKFDYKDPDRDRTNPYPQSPPLLKSVYLETNDTRPSGFNRWASHDGLKMVKYQKFSSTGWHGIAEIKGIPIYVPGTKEGIAYMEYKTGKQRIHFKIPDVTKHDFFMTYNLGVRSFKIPSQLQLNESLVFIESTQNFAHFLRDGGGVYVLRPCATSECNTSSLPKGMKEERYAELPMSLQVALMDIEGTSQLQIAAWYPEIKLLGNLNYLRITGELDVFPDEISVLTKLEVLDLNTCRVQAISPKIAELKHLKLLNLYANGLDHFPEEICELTELTHLDIGANNISEIPNCISQLTKLRELNLLSLENISLPETMLSMKELRIKGAEELKEALPKKFHFLL